MSKLRVVKPLDNNMVKYINSLPDGTTIEFDNTKGQNKEYFKNIKNTITIRIIGGLNEVEKPKFNTQEYYDRTLYKPSEVYRIIDKMEQIESKINPSWNDLEKAMYIYKTMCEGMKYDHIDVPYKGRDLNRNLLGFLTGKSVCAGFAMMYKEMLDRQGIRCLYQNKQHGHSWNLVEIDGKLVPVDLTWDNIFKNDFKHSTYDNEFSDRLLNNYYDYLENNLAYEVENNNIELTDEDTGEITAVKMWQFV